MKKTKNKEDLIAELNAIKLDLEAASWNDVSFQNLDVNDAKCRFTMFFNVQGSDGSIFYADEKLHKSFEIGDRTISVMTNSNKFIMKLGVVLGDITHGR
mgnify:CR=1 FL=1